MAANLELAPLLAEIERAFDFFNDLHWGGKLPAPVFTLNPQPPNGKRLGHYLPNAWRKDATDDTTDEIVFYSDLCLSKGLTQVLQTLLHEMCHLWHQHFGNKPPKTAASAHNKEWAREAERVGLEVDGPKGYTTPTAWFTEQVEQFNPKLGAVPFRQLAKKKATSTLTKYTCPCGVNVRVGKKEFKALCLLCDGEFLLDGGDE